MIDYSIKLHLNIDCNWIKHICNILISDIKQKKAKWHCNDTGFTQAKGQLAEVSLKCVF